MSLLQFLNILVNTILKSCHIPVTGPAPCDFCLFPILKKKLCGRRFNAGTEVISAVKGSLKQLLEKSFSTFYEEWVERWDHFISSERRCFEKRMIYLLLKIYFFIFCDFTLRFYGTPFVCHHFWFSIEGKSKYKENEMKYQTTRNYLQILLNMNTI